MADHCAFLRAATIDGVRQHGAAKTSVAEVAEASSGFARGAQGRPGNFDVDRSQRHDRPAEDKCGG